MPTKQKTTEPNHNGRPITGQKIEIRQTGGEFSKELQVANVDELKDCKVGDELTVAMRLVCIDEHFPAENRKEPDAGGLEQKLVFDPREVTIIDHDDVEAAFDAQRERVQRAKDAAEGQGRLPTDEELHSAHTAGEHAGSLVDGCVDCDAETELVAAGK